MPVFRCKCDDTLSEISDAEQVTYGHVVAVVVVNEDEVRKLMWDGSSSGFAEINDTSAILSSCVDDGQMWSSASRVSA
jgi:hypothetical protein